MLLFRTIWESVTCLPHFDSAKERPLLHSESTGSQSSWNCALQSTPSAALDVVNAVVYDMNGREATDAEPVVDALPDIEQYIFCSSAGVYLKSDQMPHREEDATDPKSRHKVFFLSPAIPRGFSITAPMNW